MNWLIDIVRAISSQLYASKVSEIEHNPRVGQASL